MTEENVRPEGRDDGSEGSKTRTGRASAGAAQSRCGLLCGECSYREQTGCPGCAQMSKPFWGESCPVKDCCEGKGQAHCGQCEAFPCDLLNQFAYDEKQGDDGKRIGQCRIWKEAGVTE